ncbi:MAG: hypothetical protein QXJ68_08260 [Methanocellales archaeon]
MMSGKNKKPLSWAQITVRLDKGDEGSMILASLLGYSTGDKKNSN